MKLGDGVGREPAPDAATYTYAGMGYANPHAVTQVSSGYSTSTFVYDNDGNLAQKTTDGTTTTYIWDYANRLTALGVVGQGTTTYGYDALGTRVYQIVATTSTTTYPFKYFSVASTTKSSTNYATSTEYVFNGDTLLATVDQGFKNGSATGTAQTRYIHPDHLGSTNVVTDASGTVVQTLDYYPYGATRVSQSSGGADSARKYIDQFADTSGLNYLQARYQDPQRGQFISEDPVFQALGSPLAEQLSKQKLQSLLANPQQLNSYSYAQDNPISIKDPSGLISTQTATILGLYAQVLSLLSQIVVQLGGGGSYNPIAASTAMLAHSTTINPGPVNITPTNQQYYGNVITQIKNSGDLNTYVKKQIKDTGQNGALSVPANDPNNSFAFQSGDLKTSLHNVDAGLSGTKSANGTWNIHVNISDTYNFDPHADYGSGYSSKAVNTLNNAAYVGQQTGVVSDYPININFDYTYKP